MGYLISDKEEVPGFSMSARRLRLLKDNYDYGHLNCEVDRKMSSYLEDFQKMHFEDDESENDKKNTIVLKKIIK